MQVQAILSPDFLGTPSTTRGDLPTNRQNFSCHPSFITVLCFLRDRTCFRAPFRLFAQILNLKMNLKQLCFQRLVLLLFSTSPVTAIWRTSCFQKSEDKPGTTRGTKLSVLQMILFPFLGRSWLLTADPLTRVSVVFAKLAERQDSKRFLQKLHGYELIHVMNGHLCLLVHFSTGSQHYCRVSGPLYCAISSDRDPFFAHHVHRWS